MLVGGGRRLRHPGHRQQERLASQRNHREFVARGYGRAARHIAQQRKLAEPVARPKFADEMTGLLDGYAA